MKKFSLFFVGLFFVFAAINFLYLVLLPKIDFDFGKTKDAHGFNQQQLDILVFGNSTAMDGINTEILSTKLGPAYNFSVGGASLETNYIQLEEYLKHNDLPKKVLLYLSSAHTNYQIANVVNPIVEYYYTDGFTTGGLKDIPLYKFRWLFVENFKILFSSSHRSAKNIRGQWSIKRVIPDGTHIKESKMTCMDTLFYNTIGYRYLWKMAAICKLKNIQFEVFEMPCWREAQNDCPDLIVNNFLGKEKVKIYNLNNFKLCDTMLDANKDWLSKDHLNYYGSVKVTNQVLRIFNR